MPPLGHWLNFLPNPRQSLIGTDGHPVRGDVMRATADPSWRMWAGNRIIFEHPIPIGAAVQRTATITHVERKEGCSGSLMFVTIRAIAGLEMNTRIVFISRPSAHPGFWWIVAKSNVAACHISN